MINNFFSKFKYPVIKQYNQTDCGAAALLSILKYYGGNDNIVHIRELANVDRQGSRIIDIVNSAKKLGFYAFGAKGNYDDLIKENLPCIAHVVIDNKLSHFVVIYKIDNNMVLIGDPGKGLYNLKRKEFEDIWVSNSVILLKPESELYNEKQESNLKWICKYLNQYSSWIIQSIFLGFLYSIIGLAISVFIRIILDNLIPSGNVSNLIVTGIFLLVILMIKSLIGFSRSRFLVILNKKFILNINSDFLSHIFHLPKTFFDKRKTGDITSRINDLNIIQRSILLVINSSVIDIIMIFGAVFFMFYFSKILALITLIIIPIYFLILLLSTGKVRKLQYEVMKNHATVESNYIDSFKGIDDILGFAVSDSFIKLNKFLFINFQESNKKLGLQSAKLNFLVEVFNTIISTTLLIFGALFVVQGELEIGQMMAVFSLYSYIMPSIINLINAHISIQGAKMALTRLKDIFLIKKEKINDITTLLQINKLEIKNGSFVWPKANQPLFQNISIKLERGRITGLYGKSGIGKSTLTNIFQRKYTLDSGDLLVNENNSDKYDLQDFRRNVALVSQSIKIFNGTILENILIGRSLNNIQEMNEIIKKYGLTDFFQKFKNGLFTLIGEEEVKLSGGEKQVVALIRALYDDPDVLIIDEGLSGIDLDIKNQIVTVIREYAKLHAVLLISHNLELMYNTDYIYLLHDGIIKDEGIPKKVFKNKQYVELEIKKEELCC